VGTMTLEGNWMRCDAFGCDGATLFDVRTISTGARRPDEIRRWFGLNGWRSVAGDGGSEGQLDFCPLHQ